MKTSAPLIVGGLLLALGLLKAAIQELRLWARSKGRVADVFDYREPLLLVFSTRARRTYPLGDMPLTVLSAGVNYFEDDQGVSAKTFFEDHERLQADLATLSRNGKQIIARKSGHHIQLVQRTQKELDEIKKSAVAQK